MTTDAKKQDAPPKAAPATHTPPPAAVPGPTPSPAPVRPPVDKAKLVKYRLMPGVGKHEGPDYTKEPNELGVYPNKVYESGDVVLSPTDLTKTFVNKFERLHADDNPVRTTPTPHSQAPEMTRELEKLSDKRLREIADDEEIDVSKAKTREELISVIKDHLNS
jgi:hypothetical protein